MLSTSIQIPSVSRVRELVGVRGGRHEEELVGAGFARVVDGGAQRVGGAARDRARRPFPDTFAQDLHVVVRVALAAAPRRRRRARTRCSTTGAALRFGRRRPTPRGSARTNGSCDRDRRPWSRRRRRRRPSGRRVRSPSDPSRPRSPAAPRPGPAVDRRVRRRRRAARPPRSRRMRATCSSIRCQRRVNGAPTAR